MTRFNIFVFCILTLVTTSTQAESPTSNEDKTASVKDFEELQSQFDGRWMGELKVNILWPKIGLKKGDITDVYADFNVDLDGMTLTGERKIGHIKWKQTFHYDAAKSAIIANCAGSNGFWSQEQWWKISENVYGNSFQGGQRDGSTFSGSMTWTFSDDGTTLIAASEGVKQGDDNDDKADRVVWKKISH
ncbi:MAG: hypothetical protein CMJ77_11695 [Planctomycetaceae bacterium]|nr:hypothetical protein [Planctomycetaceae bacterium]